MKQVHVVCLLFLLYSKFIGKPPILLDYNKKCSNLIKGKNVAENVRHRIFKKIDTYVILYTTRLVGKGDN